MGRQAWVQASAEVWAFRRKKTAKALRWCGYGYSSLVALVVLGMVHTLYRYTLLA